jgi:hypothetical protein
LIWDLDLGGLILTEASWGNQRKKRMFQIGKRNEEEEGTYMEKCT